MAESLKIGDWAYYYSEDNRCTTYYTKVISLENYPGNGRGFRVEGTRYKINNGFYFLWDRTIFKKVTLGHILNLPNLEVNCYANVNIRYCIKEMLEWLILK